MVHGYLHEVLVKDIGFWNLHLQTELEDHRTKEKEKGIT
jgi:hypothetical protein